jgi:threonine dehydrogenase-like Zn-dependent dehydrogenase
MLQYWRILSQIEAAVRSEDHVEVMGLNAAGAALNAVGEAKDLAREATLVSVDPLLRCVVDRKHREQVLVVNRGTHKAYSSSRI